MACLTPELLSIVIILWYTLVTFAHSAFGLLGPIPKNYMSVVVTHAGVSDWWTHLRSKGAHYWLWPIALYVFFNIICALSVAVAGIAIFDSYPCIVSVGTISFSKFYAMVFVLAAGIIMYKLWYTWTFAGGMKELWIGMFFILVAFGFFLSAAILTGLSGRDTSWDVHYIVAFTFSLVASLISFVMAIITAAALYYYRRFIHNCGDVIRHENLSESNLASVRTLYVHADVAWSKNQETKKGKKSKSY
jgi:hypothetical protein